MAAAMTALFTFSGGPVAGAAKKAPAKPKASVASYCTAAKEWLLFENLTLTSGAYDQAWVSATQRVMYKLFLAAPKAIKQDTLTFASYLVGSRSDLAGTSAVTSGTDIWVLVTDVPVGGAIDSRNAVGAYAMKMCKIDVLAPFKELAAGF